MSKAILFLNENPLPAIFRKGTISGKELRLRAAIDEIDWVQVVSLPGKPVESVDQSVTQLEKKIKIHLTIKWPYYFSAIILFVYGAYYCFKYHPKTIEAESPLFSGMAAVILGRLFRIPVIIEVRASYENLIKYRLKWLPVSWKKAGLDWALRWVYSRATLIVANSKTYEKQIKKMGFSSVVINPGIQYPPIARLKKQARVIGFLGRLVPEKGVDYLLEAVKLIEAKLVKEGWSVEIGGDGPEKLGLEARAKKLFGASKLKCKFLGFVNNYQALAGYGILVNPCLVNHPLEMVNVEAAWMRVPVVCFGDKQIPETVVDGVTGIKVKQQSSATLAKALSKIIDLKFSPSGFKTLVKNYSFDSQVSRMRKIYQHLGIIETYKR